MRIFREGKGPRRWKRSMDERTVGGVVQLCRNDRDSRGVERKTEDGRSRETKRGRLMQYGR